MKPHPQENNSCNFMGYTSVDSSKHRFKENISDSNDDETEGLSSNDIDDALFKAYLLNIQKNTIRSGQSESKKTRIRSLRSTKSKIKNKADDFLDQIKRKFDDSPYSNSLKSKIRFTIDKIKTHQNLDEGGSLTDEPIDLDMQADTRNKVLVTENSNFEVRSGIADIEGNGTKDLLISVANIENTVNHSQRSQTNNKSLSTLFSDVSGINDTTNNSQLSVSFSETMENRSLPEDKIQSPSPVAQNVSIVDDDPAIVEQSKTNDLLANLSIDRPFTSSSQIAICNRATFSSKENIIDTTNKIENPTMNNSPQFFTNPESSEKIIAEDITSRNQFSHENESSNQVFSKGSTSQDVVRIGEQSTIIDLANDSSRHNFKNYGERRRLRPRTLKQMKPYLVDRYEHEAQLVGDFKRARLIEQAALEQNADLLEKLQEEDRIVREQRMIAALQKEKAKESRKSVKNKKDESLIANSVSREEATDFGDSDSYDNDSEDSELLAIFDKYKMNPDISNSPKTNLEIEERVDGAARSFVSTDLENSIEIESSSDEENNSFEDDEEVDSQIVALEKKLSKVHVLPKSYIRQVIQDEKSKKARKVPVSLHSNNQNQNRKKGLAIRKIHKITNIRGKRDLDFVDYDEKNVDNDFEEILPNPYLDNSASDFNTVLLHPHDEGNNEMISASTDLDSITSSPDLPILDKNDSELSYANASSELKPFLPSNSGDDVTILEYVTLRPEKASKVTKQKDRDENTIFSDECTESRSPMIDRMLSYNSRNKSKKGALLRKRRVLVPKNIDRKSHPKRRLTASQEHIRKLRPFNRMLESNRSQDISERSSSVRNKSQGNDNSLSKRGSETLGEYTSKEKHRKYKRKKFFDYKKDTENFDYNRNPKTTTLQLEQIDTSYLANFKRLRFKSSNTNPIFLEFPQRDSESLSMANYEYIFNHTSRVSKLRPLDFEGIKFPESSLLRWIDIDFLNDFMRISPADIIRDYVKDTTTFQSQNIEEQILLVFNNCLEYIKSANMYPVDSLVRQLKIITQELIDLELGRIPIIISKIEIFMQNSLNIINHKNKNCFVFIILFFPIFQLGIIIKSLKLTNDKSNVLKNALKAFKKHLVNYFQNILNFWNPKSIANCLIDYENERMATIMLDVLLILFKLTSSIFSDETCWATIIGKVLTTNFKYENLESYFSFLELMANFNNNIQLSNNNQDIVLQVVHTNASSANWGIIDFFVDRISSVSIPSNREDEALQEYNLYQKHKKIFKLVNGLIINYNWVESDLVFKSLIKLIKRRNFISFSNELLDFKSFDKILSSSSMKISSSDNICTTFIRMVIRSYSKQKSCVDYKRIVPIFEPNSNIFSNNAKPDTFLQTFVNKMNILTLNGYLVESKDYSLIIVRLLKSIIIQNDLACYEKALDSMISYCKYTKIKGRISIFDEFFTTLILNYEIFIKQMNTNQVRISLESTDRFYFSLITTITSKILNFSLEKQDLSKSIIIFLTSISFPKVLKLSFFKSRQLPASLNRLLDTILRDINKAVKHWNTNVKNVVNADIDRSKAAELLNHHLWIPIVSLLEASSCPDAFVYNESIITDLVFTLSNVSNLLVQLQMDNWIGLDYKWNLYNLNKYQLIWLSKAFYLGGEFFMKADPDPYIDTFVQIIAKADPGKFSHQYFNNLIKADILNNEWLAFKKKLKVSNMVLFGFGLVQRTLILSHFVNNLLTVSKLTIQKRKKAVEYLDKILNIIVSEFEEFKQKKVILTYDAKQIKVSDYETFVKNSLLSISSPYGRKLLYKSENWPLVLKLFGNPKTLGEKTLKNEIEDILVDIDDNKAVDSGAERSMKIMLLIQNKLAAALINNKQDKFITDFCNSIIKVEKEYCSNEIFSSSSKLIYICELITVYLGIFGDLGQFSWLFLLYLFRTLHKLTVLSSPLGIRDFELLLKLIGSIAILCQKPVDVVEEDLNFLTYNVKKFYHSYMRYAFAEIYDLIYDIYMLLLPEDRPILENILTKRTNFMKKRDWKEFPERNSTMDLYGQENDYQHENSSSSSWSQESNTHIITKPMIDELGFGIKSSLKTIFENHKFGDLKSKNVKSSANMINNVDLYFINAESTETVSKSYLKLVGAVYDMDEKPFSNYDTILTFSY